ncbi:unnamed protein product [Merluccius merluccius]
MNLNKGGQLLVSPCSVAPPGYMATGHRSPGIRMPIRTNMSPSVGTAGAGGAGGGGEGGGEGEEAPRCSMARGKTPAAGAYAPVVFPALSLRRQVLTNGSQISTASTGQRRRLQAATFEPAANVLPTAAGQDSAGHSSTKLFHQPAFANLRVTNSPMLVQSLGPSRTHGPGTLAPPHPPAHPHGVLVPCTDARSLLSRESLASTTLSLCETQSMASGRQDWPHGYRVLPPLGPLLGSPEPGPGGDHFSVILSPGETAMSGTTSNSASLPSYLFTCDSASPKLVAAAAAARSKKRALSMSPLSDAMGIDFNGVIRTSPTSLVAYINGSRSSPLSHRSVLSPVQAADVYGHLLGVRGSCIPRADPCHRVAGAALGLTPCRAPPHGGPGCVRMQRLEEGDGGGGGERGALESQMANMAVQQQVFLGDAGAPEKTRDSLPPSAHVELSLSTHVQEAPAPQGPPPPYHHHHHLRLPMPPDQNACGEPLSCGAAPPPPHGTVFSFLPQAPAPEGEEDDDGEPDDVGSRDCRWAGCGAVYDQKEELVRHIEALHVDQRRGEDYACHWSGCPRRLKPFNARYKLLIHMRVHSGEKPNRCPFEGCKKAFSRLENLKIHVRSHTGEKPYQCQHPGCYKAFSNSSDRAKHQRTHLDTKPYACQVPGCLKRYTDPSSLRKHVKSHSSRERQLRKKLRPSASVPMEELKGCLTIQPLQANLSPLGLSSGTSNELPLYPELSRQMEMHYSPMVCAGMAQIQPTARLLMPSLAYGDDLSSILSTQHSPADAPLGPLASISGDNKRL